MKVCFLINNTVMDGSSISFINLVKGLSKLHVECYVLHPDKIVDEKFKNSITPYIKGLYYADIKLYGYGKNKNNFKEKIKQNIKRSQLYQFYRTTRENHSVDKVINQIKPDLIHTNVGVIQVGYRLSKKHNIPHVWHLREYQTKDFNLKIEPSKPDFIKMLQDSYVITITKDIASYFNLQNYDNARVIYNGCFSKYDTALILPKKKYFLCCSRISEEKGYEEVIEAFATFYKKYPDYKLLIAGSGPKIYIDKLKHIAQKCNCIDSVQFLGFQSNVKPLMDNATSLIVASRFEGFGRMTAEAAFRGCQVIGRDTGGTKEILGMTGGILYSGGKDELEKAMEKAIIFSDNKYMMKAKYAQKVAKEKFSNEQYVSSVYSFYKDILD